MALAMFPVVVGIEVVAAGDSGGELRRAVHIENRQEYIVVQVGRAGPSALLPATSDFAAGIGKADSQGWVVAGQIAGRGLDREKAPVPVRQCSERVNEGGELGVVQITLLPYFVARFLKVRGYRCLVFRSGGTTLRDQLPRRYGEGIG